MVHGIYGKKLSPQHQSASEAASADAEAAAGYTVDLARKISDGGYTQWIFNVDRTTLYWVKMPYKTFMALEEKSMPGFKATKDRLTVLLGRDQQSW